MDVWADAGSVNPVRRLSLRFRSYLYRAEIPHRSRTLSQVTDLLGECLVLEGLEVESRGLAPVLALECRAHSGGGFLSVADWAV